MAGRAYQCHIVSTGRYPGVIIGEFQFALAALSILSTSLNAVLTGKPDRSCAQMVLFIDHDTEGCRRFITPRC
jgi:hypothetical protein